MCLSWPEGNRGVQISPRHASVSSGGGGGEPAEGSSRDSVGIEITIKETTDLISRRDSIKEMGHRTQAWEK